MVIKIISSGQAGVERAALDWAIIHGVRHGGYCSKALCSEEQIRTSYRLTELLADSNSDAVERNVVESDGTLLITEGDALSDVSALAVEYCRNYEKPLLLIKHSEPNGARRLVSFVEKHKIFVIHITGPGTSKANGLVTFVTSIMDEALPIFLFPRRAGKIDIQ